MGETTKWAGTQYLPFLALVISILIFVGGIIVADELRDDIDDVDDARKQNTADISNMSPVSETTVKGWVNSANEKIIEKNSSFETRINSLESKPVASQSVFTQIEKNSLINEINSLKAKMTIAEKDIKDLEDDTSSSSSRSTSRDIEQDTTLDTPSKFYDRDQRITFSGLADSRAEVELFISFDGDRFERVGDDITDSNGRWIITCISECTENRGDYEVYAINIDNDDKSRTRDYEVQ